VSAARLLQKIRRPMLPLRMLPRPALVQRLAEAIVGSSTGRSACKLVLVQAPAGYGKTTLLAEFAHTATIPCCWLVLDRSDTDPVLFLESLLMSLRERFPASDALLDPLLAEARVVATAGEDAHRFDAIMDAVADTIASKLSECFALILCNFQEIDTCPPLHHLFNQLLRLPSSCVVVIESRSLPPLDLVPLLARREMTILSREHLRLSAQEIQELARLLTDTQLGDTEAEQLAAAFDGWLVGLLLGTRLGDVRFLQRAKSAGYLHREPSAGNHLDQRHLFAYVVQDVFGRYPDEYAFLKAACVLEEMTPLRCAGLLSVPVPVASDFLAALEQYGLFVSSADEQGVTTCHPALRDLLVEDLRRRSPERYAQLHRRAAELLYAEQRYEQAITHAQAAGADDLAADLIVSACESFIAQGHLETLTRWIDAVPEPMKAHSAALLLYEARVAALRGDSARALAQASAAQAALADACAGEVAADHLLVQIDIMIVTGVALCLQGRYQESQTICQQVLTMLPAEEVKRQAEVQDCLGRCALHMGAYPAALTHFQQALDSYSQHTNILGAGAMHMSLNMVYRLLGNMALAEHHCTCALACYDQLQNRRGLANAYLGLGSIRQAKGLLDEAEAFFTQSRIISREPILLHRLQAYALADLGELSIDQGHYDRALALAEEALALMPGDALVRNTALSTLAKSYLFLGDVETARLMLSRMVLPGAHGERLGKYHAEHDLTEGMILLFEHRAASACAVLKETETALNTTGMKLQQIQANLLIAACHLVQGQVPEMLRRLETVGTMLSTLDCYAQRVPIELRHLPMLAHAIKTLPEAAPMRAIFHLEPEQASAPALLTAASPPAGSLQAPSPMSVELTIRERDVLRLLAQGLTSPQIATQLMISVVTVNFHVRSIYRKLRVSSRAAATRYAIEYHLV
jgi:LuxR family transcriptional regulator, maltose regulon positive regulatory protein